MLIPTEEKEKKKNKKYSPPMFKKWPYYNGTLEEYITYLEKRRNECESNSQDERRPDRKDGRRSDSQDGRRPDRKNGRRSDRPNTDKPKGEAGRVHGVITKLVAYNQTENANEKFQKILQLDYPIFNKPGNFVEVFKRLKKKSNGQMVCGDSLEKHFKYVMPGVIFLNREFILPEIGAIQSIPEPTAFFDAPPVVSQPDENHVAQDLPEMQENNDTTDTPNFDNEYMFSNDFNLEYEIDLVLRGEMPSVFYQSD